MKRFLVNFTIGKKLALGFFVLIVLSAFMAIFSINQLKKLNNVAEEIKDTTLPGLRMTMQLNISISDYRAYEVSHILAKDAGAKKKREELLNESKATIVKMSKELDGILTDKEDKKFLIDFNVNWNDYILGSDDLLKLSSAAKDKDALDLWNDPISVSIFDVTREQLEKLKNKKIAEANNKVLEGQKAYEKALKLLLAGLLVLILSSVAIAYLLIKNVKGNLTKAVVGILDGTNMLADLSAKLHQASNALSSSSHDQASMVQESAATVEEVSAMVTKTAENAAHSKHLVQKSTDEAQSGKHAVDDMVQSINDISESNTAIIDKIEENNQRLDDIIKIISEIETKTKVINDIVFQTKLLSFNASVEAARASEHGKGFAVVAEEVANLAQMSGKASNEISSMLENSIRQVKESVAKTKSEILSLSDVSKEKVNSGLLKVKNCEEALENIITNVSSVSTMVEEISSASSEQATGVQEINKAIANIDVVTQKNADMAKETSNIVDNLNGQVINLNTVIDELRREVG